MAKNDNLKDFVTDLADAIREKKGTTDLINPQDFADEIRNLPSGGGEVVEVEEKDICFYDYDGTLLFSYTIEEAQALTELPTPKGHEGLIFDGWNWDYEDVIALDYPMDIGAMYITDDGKTRFYLEVEDEEGVYITLRFSQTANDAIVDFGDGSPTETSADTIALIPHHYAKGSYILNVWSSGGKIISFIGTFPAITSLGNIADKSVETLRKIEFGANIRIEGFAFRGCINLATISAPRVANSMFGWSSTFENCVSLKWLNIPMNTSYIYGGMLSQTYKLKGISLPNTNIILNGSCCTNSGFQKMRIPKTISKINGSIFSGSPIKEFVCYSGWTLSQFFLSCRELTKVILHEDSVLGGRAFESCCSLREVQIPENTAIIPSQCFFQCTLLKELSFPKGLTSIDGGYVFSQCGAKKYDFSLCEQIPTLANSNSFSPINNDAKIIVPDALYDEWIAATNWAIFADRIVKSSEYTE